jgi:hypothetical protein
MVTQLMQNQIPTPTIQAQPTARSDMIINHSVAYEIPLTENANKYPTVLEDVMNSINELKMALPSMSEEVVDRPINGHGTSGSECIFGSSSTYSIGQILSQYLPDKVDADRLLATYFGSDTFIQPFIHTTHFQRQYWDFWNDTSTVSPIWLSILFSIFNMASMTQNAANMCSARTGNATKNPAFDMAAGECLVLGQYHRAQPYVAEALVLYAHSISLKSLDPSRESGAIISMAVRTAYEMGYHRDPDVFGTFSVFEGEMRRRFWAVCKQVDTMIAFQLGLPSNIRLENCDTQSPRNLLDSDFSPESESLPPSRPETEATRILWFIVKDRLMPSFTRVCQNALSLRQKSEEDVRALDEEVRLARSTIPVVLQARPKAECIADSQFIIMTRFYIELLHLKSLCILHRKHMSRGNLYSTQKCVEAGLEIVRMVIDAYKEFSPGGQLYEVRWMFNNYYMSDFLLGVIILCLYVNMGQNRGVGENLPANGPGSEIFTLLEQSHAVCVDKASASKDARKVSLAIQLAVESAGKSRMHAQSLDPDHTDMVYATSSGQAPTTNDGRQDDLSWFTPQPVIEQFGMHGISFAALDPFSFMSTEPFHFDTMFATVEPSVWDQDMLHPDDARLR